MTRIEPKTLKGFRDFLPNQAKKRQYVINTLKSVFESYGFEPLETPALEYEEILLGKYGEEGDKLMYRFEDNGKRRVALRYDQTVPLARVVAQYANDLPVPFKRYQISNVWRAENPQKGRYREFLQCDIDIVGSSSPLSDAEIIAVAAKSLEKLGFKNFKILLNDREAFQEIVEERKASEKEINSALRTIDKIKKISEDGVINELVKKGISEKRASELIELIKKQEKSDVLKDIDLYLQNLELDKSLFEFSPTLARGLDYYTGMIFEIEVQGYDGGSVAGGGRYDDLIGIFANKQVPAVGFAFGFDRLIEAMEQLDLFPKEFGNINALITIFSKELKEKSIKVYSTLRNKGLKLEIYLDENTPLEKQLKYADKKGILYTIIIGPKEARENKITLRNMKTGAQKTIEKEEL